MKTESKSKVWHYQPKVPIVMSPVFDLPPQPAAAFAWALGTWTKLTPAVSHMTFTLVTFFLFWPSAIEIQQPGGGWALKIYLINLGATLLLGSALHGYLYKFAGQEMRLKFDVRPMQKGARFTFGDQVWDNLFWSLVWAVPIWSLWMIAYFYVVANGWVPHMESMSSSPVWFFLFFFVIRFWQSFHFYWIHRLIHTPFLFRTVHHVHHRNISVGPWSGISMHPLELLLYFSGILIHFILPSHPIHVIFHMFSLALGALLSHSGFEKIIVRDTETLKAGSFHHQLHHRYFQCNYGSEEVPLDRWFSSFHDGTDAANDRIRERKRPTSTLT